MVAQFDGNKFPFHQQSKHLVVFNLKSPTIVVGANQCTSVKIFKAVETGCVRDEGSSMFTCAAFIDHGMSS